MEMQPVINPINLNDIEKEIEICKKRLAFLEDIKKQLQETQSKSQIQKEEHVQTIGHNGWGC